MTFKDEPADVVPWLGHSYLSAGDNPYASGDRAYRGCAVPGCGRPRSEHGPSPGVAARGVRPAPVSVAGGTSASRLASDPPKDIEVIDGATPSVLGLWRAATRAIPGSACDTTDLDLAALAEGKLSVEGRRRLTAHLNACTLCMDVAKAVAEGLEATRRKAIDDVGAPGGKGEGGSA